MKIISNECGSRNSFGFYDARAKEIVLTRPCTKKADIKDVYLWLDTADDLQKLSIGIGPVEHIVMDNSSNGLYLAARGTIKKQIIQNTAADNEILYQIFSHLENKDRLRKLNLRCFIFSEDVALFERLLAILKSLKSLTYLDLTGCYFSDDQLIDLARTISELHVVSLVWPEPRMTQLVLDQVVRAFSTCRALVVVRGAPLEIEKIAEDNRQWVFRMVERPSTLGEKEHAIITEYAQTFRFAVAYERDRMLQYEKTIEGVLIPE